MRCDVLEPRRRGRQPDEADEHSDETAVLPAVPDRAHQRTDCFNGRRRNRQITEKQKTTEFGIFAGSVVFVLRFEYLFE